MAETNRVLNKLNQDYHLQDKLKNASDTASKVMDKAQTNLRDIRSRGREVFYRATDRMTPANWMAIGLGATAVGLAVFFTYRHKRSSEESRSSNYKE